MLQLEFHLNEVANNRTHGNVCGLTFLLAHLSTKCSPEHEVVNGCPSSVVCQQLMLTL